MSEENQQASSASEEDEENPCDKTLPCGHLCGGIAGEIICLQCLHGCSNPSESANLMDQVPCTSSASPVALKLYQQAKEICVICYSSSLSTAPAIQLKCGHIFHMGCVKDLILNKWVGINITFGFLKCPLCQSKISHPSLENILSPFLQLQGEVISTAIKCAENNGTVYSVDDPEKLLNVFYFYQCLKCQKPFLWTQSFQRYWVLQEDKTKHICGACHLGVQGTICFLHGTSHIVYKCHFCCNFGNKNTIGIYVCSKCNEVLSDLMKLPSDQLPQCPVGPGGVQLQGSCPLEMEHPPTGSPFIATCFVCMAYD